MRKGRSTGTPTPAQELRFFEIQRIGCICCRKEGMGAVPCEVHHLNEGGVHGGRRRGHDDTIGLCGWHHRGVCREGWSIEDMAASYGPSWHHHATAFTERYGGDDLLLQYQNELLMLYR
jgi:hypothetical protein